MQCCVWRAALVLTLLVATGCQRAGRYRHHEAQKQPADTSAASDESAQPRHLWSEPIVAIRDIPVHFIPDTSAEWAGLPQFWNLSPPPGAGMATIHLGVPPLAGFAGIVATEHIQTIKIKTPRGLPDPAPFIPDASPLSYARWRLGKLLFFEPILQPDNRRSCASCHQPGHGFTQDYAYGRDGESRNTLSLINCVFNQAQFWDGRARTLEETIYRPTAGTSSMIDHSWGNIARTLADTPELNSKYAPLFHQSFGIVRPTQDAVAKALATYMRTILSGDSLVDRAHDERRRLREAELTVKHFAAALEQNSPLAPALKGARDRDATARELEYGHRVFHGGGSCVRCHQGPLYTDGGFHNIGLDGTDAEQLAGKSLGRFEHLPVGLKDKRFMGAYRTPTLRAVPRTPRYMHDGRFTTMANAIGYFNTRFDDKNNRYLSNALLTPRANLDRDDIAALVLYLQALDGAPIDAVVAQP